MNANISSYKCLVSVGAWLVMPLLLTSSLARAQMLRGQILYEEKCAVCHSSGATGSRAPTRDTLREFTPERVLEAITNGVMKSQAEGLTDEQKRGIAEYITLRPMGSSAKGDASSMKNQCSVAAPIGELSARALWNGWSPDHSNARFQSSGAAGITADQIPRLKLKWAFGFPGATSAYAQPTVVDGHLFTSSDAGYVYSLAAETGCIYWSFSASAGVRTPIIIGNGPARGMANVRRIAYFGDVRANVYAVDADTGRLLWKAQVERHPQARITGGLVLEGNRLLVPVSSLEELSGNDNHYECCTFRGSVVALEANSGNQIWKTYTIQDEPKPARKSASGVQLWGPAGGAVWNTPTIDIERGEVYFGTGNAYTSPAAPTTDSVMALDLRSGRILWWHQLVAQDAWVIGCGRDDRARTDHCPDRDLQNSAYFDVDMAASPILHQLPDGRRILITTGEAGLVNALDPAHEGRVVWTADLGRMPMQLPRGPGQGENQPGVAFGGAVDERAAYFPLERHEGGITAINVITGKEFWHTLAPKPNCNGERGCNAEQQSAATVIPGAVFSGARDGMLRAYSTGNGKILWEFNTKQSFETVNGVAAKGGGLGGPGVTVAGGMVFSNSGYGGLQGIPGNVLLAFGIE